MRLAVSLLGGMSELSAESGVGSGLSPASLSSASCLLTPVSCPLIADGDRHVVRAVDDVVEQVAELLQHVAQRRLGAGDARHLLVGEREDVRRQLAASGSSSRHGRSRASTTRRTSRPAALPGAAPSPCRASGTWTGLFSRSWM